jgi:hypothetical protein
VPCADLAKSVGRYDPYHPLPPFHRIDARQQEANVFSQFLRWAKLLSATAADRIDVREQIERISVSAIGTGTHCKIDHGQ